MKKILFFLSILMIPLVVAITLEENTRYNPSKSNVTYRLNETLYGITQAIVNQTCLTINTTSFCTQSPTDIRINISSNNITGDTTAPIITNLRNTSTDNDSTYITWSCSEPCNSSLLWYNNTSLVGSVFNKTLSTTPNVLIENLLNDTTYFINLTVWDAAGNSANNKTFNFTTAKNTVAETPTSSGGGGGGGLDCIYISDRDQQCYWSDFSRMACVEGCPDGFECNEIYRCIEAEPIELISKFKDFDIKAVGVILLVATLVTVLIILDRKGYKFGKKANQ